GCVCIICIVSVVFFFQAEDGIRDRNVTGVQTCALPISDLFCCCESVIIAFFCFQFNSHVVISSIKNIFVFYLILLFILVFVCKCLDQKSTRLNSCHASISYAVFCL